MTETTITFDTETINIKDLDVFDFGYVVKRGGKVLEKGSFLVEEVYGTDLYKKAYFYEKNDLIYKEKLKNKEIEIKPIAEIRKIFNAAIINHQVDLIAGFVIDFDLRALSYTFSKYISPTTITIDSLSSKFNVIDIAILFAVYYGSREDYKEFCRKNGFVTDKGNYKTTAEVIYKFLKSDMNYSEEHTAYQDSLEESEILEIVFEQLTKEGKIELFSRAIAETLNKRKAYTFFK